MSDKPKVEITEMWAWVAVDPEDGVEGVIGEYIDAAGSWLPFVGADRSRVDQLEPMAKNIAHKLGRTVRLKHFTTMAVVKEHKGVH